MLNLRKEKRRNSEKRKEKSRNAARCRREKETELFYELGHMLPMPHSVCVTLDKAGIMRLVLCHMKIHKLLSGAVDTVIKVKVDKDAEVSDSDQKLIDRDKLMDTLYPKALEGFLLVLSKDGDIAYLSENVSRYLGLTQIDLLGQSIYDYSHPCDHEEIREQLSDRPGLKYISSKPEREHHSFLMRMKCTLTPKGKNVNLKSATYKVVQCSGHIRLSQSDTTSAGQLKPPVPCMVMLVLPIPHPADIETPLDTKTFMTRHSMDMKFTDCDDRIQELIGYAPDDLVGKSFYDFHHALDGSQIERCHRNLFAKGQTTTGHYRFLAKEGGYVWLETQATVIYHNKTNKAECVVCVNYVLSGLENADIPISLSQYRRSNPNEVQRSTEKVFAPRMNGMASEFPNWITSNEEQESEEELLNYLAPTPGDTMIPLPVDIWKTDLQKKFKAFEASDSETCIPFNPFAMQSDKKGKALLAADQVLFGQPGTMVDIPPKELDLMDNNSPLNSSHDPLLTTDVPNKNAVNTNKQKCEELLSDEDLLCMIAPYIPMGEDLDLSIDLDDDNFNVNPEVNSTWKPVDPFSYNLEKDGFTNYNPVSQESNNVPFSSTYLGQPSSPQSHLSSPMTLSQPCSPGSSFGGSLPNLCAISSALPFSPLRSPVELDGMDMPGTSKSIGPPLQPDSGRLLNSSIIDGTSSVCQNLSDVIYTSPTMSVYQTAVMPSSSNATQMRAMVDYPPYYNINSGRNIGNGVPTSLKRRLPIPCFDTGQSPSRMQDINMKSEPVLLAAGEPPEKLYCHTGEGIQPINIPPVTFGAEFSHSNFLQQVARKINCHTDTFQSVRRATLRTSPVSLKNIEYPVGQRQPDKLPLNEPTNYTSQPTQSSVRMDDLCRILNLST